MYKLYFCWLFGTFTSNGAGWWWLLVARRSPTKKKKNCYHSHMDEGNERKKICIYGCMMRAVCNVHRHHSPGSEQHINERLLVAVSALWNAIFTWSNYIYGQRDVCTFCCSTVSCWCSCSLRAHTHIFYIFPSQPLFRFFVFFDSFGGDGWAEPSSPKNWLI